MLRRKTSLLYEILYLALFLVLFNFLYNTTVDLTIYKNNKLAIEHVKTCINYNKDASLTDALNECATDSLVGGNTGDVYVVRLRDMKILWDNSVDCKDNNKSMYLTKDSICKLAKDKDSCIKLADRIHKGYDGEKIWQFDNTKEYDDWVIMPNPNQNFDGSFRSIEGLKDQIAIVQGTQYNEYTQYLKYIKYLVNLFIGIYLVMLVIILVVKTEEDSRNDE